MNEANKLGFTTKELYEKYHKLSNFNEKTRMLDSLLNNQDPNLEKLLHYIANRIQLAARKPIIKRQKNYTQHNEEFNTSDDISTAQTIAATIFDTIKNLADQHMPLDNLLDNLKNIHVGLIFTEHPTDPLSKHANHALSNINNNTTKADLEKYIGELWHNPLTPSNKRSVMEEIDRDLIMLQKVFNVYPQFIKRLREAIKTYYPTASREQLVILDNIMAAKLGNNFLQGGGWAGFDADGNDEVTPDRTLYALLKRRTTSMEQYIIYIKDNILIYLDTVKDHIIIEEYNNLINSIKDKKLNLEQQINKLESHIQGVSNDIEHFEAVSEIEQECKDYYLTSELLLTTLDRINNKHSILQNNKSYQDSIYVFTGLVNNFGMGMGRADIRQKSYTNLRAITVILEDLKLNQDVSNSIIFTQFLKEKTFVELEEKEKICLLEELLNNSTNSNSILNLIQYKFQTGYYLKDEESYAYLKKKKSFPSDSKIPLNQEVHRELWRNNISCNNDQIIQKSIISNTEHCSDLFIQDFLLNIFNYNNKIVTMPLIESMKDLEHSETIIHEYILYKIENFFIKTIKAEIKQYGKSKLQELLAIPDISGIKSLLKEGPNYFVERRRANPELDQYLKQIRIESMVGFSDSERESGTSALHSVDKSIQLQRALADKYGIQYNYFGGAGGDIERGGESRNCQEQTFQGNVKRNLASTENDLLWKLEKQFSTGCKELIFKEIFEESMYILLEKYKDLSSKAYEFLYDIGHGYGKLTAVLYGIGAHNTIVDASNFSSRATILGNKSNVSFMPLPKLRAITKVQDDELSRHYLGLNVGPDIAMKELGTEDFIKLYRNSSTQRDIIVKTAIGIALTDWSIVWLNFPKELRPYNNDGTLDKLRLASMAWQSQEDLKLLKNLEVENIIKKHDYKDPEYRQIISMVANLNAMLHQNNLEFAENLFNTLKQIYPGYQASETLKKSTDILFFMPELKKYYDLLLSEIEPISILTNLISLNTQVYAKHISELFGDNSSKIVGNIAAAFEAFRIDPVYHSDPLYFDHQEPITNLSKKYENRYIKQSLTNIQVESSMQ